MAIKKRSLHKLRVDGSVLALSMTHGEEWGARNQAMASGELGPEADPRPFAAEEGALDSEHAVAISMRHNAAPRRRKEYGCTSVFCCWGKRA